RAEPGREGLLQHQFGLAAVQRLEAVLPVALEEPAAEAPVVRAHADVALVLVDALNLPLRPCPTLGRRHVQAVEERGDAHATPAPLVVQEEDHPDDLPMAAVAGDEQRVFVPLLLESVAALVAHGAVGADEPAGLPLPLLLKAIGQ